MWKSHAPFYELHGQDVPQEIKNKEHHDHAEEEQAYNSLMKAGWQETDLFKPPVVGIRDHVQAFPKTELYQSGSTSLSFLTSTKKAAASSRCSGLRMATDATIVAIMKPTAVLI